MFNSESVAIQHFLRDEPVVGIEYEAQLQKTLLPREYKHIYVAVTNVSFPDFSILS